MMKRSIVFALFAFSFFAVGSALAAEDNTREINWNYTCLQVGDTVWVNDVDVGDGVYFGHGWFDPNGYVFPHKFGVWGGPKKLRRATVVEVNQAEVYGGGTYREINDSDHPLVKVAVKRENGTSSEYWSWCVIPQQKVVLLNW